MPPVAHLDPASLDLNHVIAGRAEIDAENPQRHEFSLLDAVVYLSIEDKTFAGYVDLSTDDWWVRGHVPGRPLFPGVLMIESAAQLSCYAYKQYLKTDSFLGFAGVDEVKFRGTVEPPNRFVLIGKALQLKPRRMITNCQGFFGDTMVFEAKITGMPV